MTRFSLRPTLHSLGRTLMVPLLASALILNPMTTRPALAGSGDNDDVGALLAALLGLAVVGTIVSNADRSPRHVAPPPNIRVDKPRKPRRHVVDDRWMHPKYRLPNKCLRTFKTQFGKKRYWARNCLNNRYGYVKSLPRACRDTVVIRNKNGIWVPRKIYHPRCLKEAGYRKRH